MPASPSDRGEVLFKVIEASMIWMSNIPCATLGKNSA
jgi:hypothetical protein